MSAPDYTDAQANARQAQRERYAPGTRVTHAYTGQRAGVIVKLNVGTLKRQKPLGRWSASVLWDGAERTTNHDLSLLKPVDYFG